MDPAANAWTHDPHVTVFYCERCCGQQPAGGGGGPNCRYVASCVGDVDAARLASAFADGSDGVLIIGCLGDTCRTPQSEVQALGKIHAGTGVLRQFGLEPARLRRHWLSPREAANVPALVAAFRRRLITLGGRRDASYVRLTSASPEPMPATRN